MIALLDRSALNVNSEIISRLRKIGERGFDLSKRANARLDRLFAEIRSLRASALKQMGDELYLELDEFLKYEVSWQMGTLNDVAISAGLTTTAPTLRRVRAAAFSQPFESRLLRDWSKSLEPAEFRRVRWAISNGVVEGRTTPQITALVNRELLTTNRHTTAIVRTATNHTQNAARNAVALENAELLKGVQYVSTLDSKTSERCRFLDKQVFPVGEGPRPPQHINCRSTTTMVLKRVRTVAGRRESVNGLVPDDLSYYEWLKKQKSDDLVSDVVGAKNLKAFRSGNLAVKRFNDQSGKLYNLSDLKKADRSTYKVVG